MAGDEKHDSAATSTLDVLWVLYERVLRVDPARPNDPDRDRFLLSKGHGPIAYYAVLAATLPGGQHLAYLRGLPLADRPHRVLSLGVARREHRRYGTAADHDVAHGLDVDGLGAAIGDFLQH